MDEAINYSSCVGTEWISNGNGDMVPCPPVLTEDEALRYLRIDCIGIKNPSATLRRYREKGLLRAVQISKGVFYPRAELQRFVEKLMKENPR